VPELGHGKDFYERVAKLFSRKQTEAAT
jgi:peptide/nickel transport system permease protein